MDAQHDALAHRFIARTLAETTDWPPSLQVALHELAFVALPDSVLALDRDEACAWARRWRTRFEQAAATVSSADAEWVANLAEQWRASRPADQGEPAPSSGELSRLADLMARLGPLALRLPWRNAGPGQA
jgi:hypothetical protein